LLAALERAALLEALFLSSPGPHFYYAFAVAAFLTGASETDDSDDSLAYASYLILCLLPN